PDRLFQIVAELHRGMAVHRGDLAHQRDGAHQPGARGVAADEVVGKVGAPTEPDLDPGLETLLQLDDVDAVGLKAWNRDIEAVRENDELFRGNSFRGYTHFFPEGYQ